VIRLVPTPVDYWICTTFQPERMLRAYYINQHKERPLLHTYQELARLFPRGLAETPELPEEVSGAVKAAWVERRKQ